MWHWFRLKGFALAAAAIMPLLAACNQDLGCSDETVQEALGQALDDALAAARNWGTVDYTINDIVTVQQSSQSASCKALVHYEIDIITTKRSEEATVLYTAEITDRSNVLVTLHK